MLIVHWDLQHNPQHEEADVVKVAKLVVLPEDLVVAEVDCGLSNKRWSHNFLLVITPPLIMPNKCNSYN